MAEVQSPPNYNAWIATILAVLGAIWWFVKSIFALESAQKVNDAQFQLILKELAEVKSRQNETNRMLETVIKSKFKGQS